MRVMAYACACSSGIALRFRTSLHAWWRSAWCPHHVRASGGVCTPERAAASPAGVLANAEGALVDVARGRSAEKLSAADADADADGSGLEETRMRGAKASAGEGERLARPDERVWPRLVKAVR